MPYSETLRQRIETTLRGQRGIEEKKMFGGACFMLYGNMLVGVLGPSMIARVGPETAQQHLADEGIQLFDPTGRRPMKGWLVLEPEAIESDGLLKLWIDRALEFVKELPPKD